MLNTYCDAKTLTLSANIFRARVVTSHLADKFSFNSDRTATDAMKNYDFQYVNLTVHLEAMK